MTFRVRSDDKQKDRPVDVKRDLRLMNTIPANSISSIAHVDASEMAARSLCRCSFFRFR